VAIHCAIKDEMALFAKRRFWVLILAVNKGLAGFQR
jgi:hypothetical protein